MAYDVVIRRNADGVERTYHCDFEWQTYEDGTDNVYWWTEGNAGCDCNRAMDFASAGGESRDLDAPCGDSRYTVVRFILPDGRIVPGDATEA